MEEGE